MKKVLKRSFVVFCLALSMLIVAPFHIAYADTYSSVTVTQGNILSFGISEQSSSTGLVNMYIVMDKEYFGTLSVKFNVTNNVTITCKFGLSGNVGYGSTSQTAGWINAVTFNSIAAQNLRVRDDNDSVENVYNADYTNFIGYQYWSLYAMEYSSDVLPISAMYSAGFRRIDSFPNAYNPAGYPYIRMADEDLYIAYFTNRNENNDSVSIMISPKADTSLSVSIEKVESPMYTYYTSGDYVFNMFRIHCTKPDAYEYKTWADQYMVKWGNKEGLSTVVIPVWYGVKSGMSEEMLRFLGLIEVDESAADLQNEQSEFSQSASDLYTYENDFNSSLNDSLDDINVNFDIGNTFGSKFLASASWVRQQFDALTSSSPFGSVLSFSLILGLALLIIGKAVR